LVDADDAHLTPEEEQRLYRHYGFDADATDPDAVYGDRGRSDEGYSYYDRSRTADADRSRGGAGGSAESASTTRMEEELEVDKQRRPAGTARLKKYTVTEDVEMKVPVKKVARLVREPASGDASRQGAELGDSEEEVTLMEEHVDVTKRPVAKEQVGLAVDEVTDERLVREQVLKGKVDVEGDVRPDAEGGGRKPGPR
jgi:uncharacterized protein (TIGR02271 family)